MPSQMILDSLPKCPYDKNEQQRETGVVKTLNAMDDIPGSFETVFLGKSKEQLFEVFAR